MVVSGVVAAAAAAAAVAVLFFSCSLLALLHRCQWNMRGVYMYVFTAYNGIYTMYSERSNLFSFLCCRVSAVKPVTAWFQL